MKKLGIFLLLAAMVLLCVAPMGVAEQEALPVRWLLPGTEPYDMPVVEEALEAAMREDGLNLDLQFMFYGWDIWDQKVNVMLASGDEFEIINTMDNGSPSTTSLLSKNAIVPLDDLLAEYGQDMLEMFDEACWSQATIDGKIMAIPAPWIDMTVENYLCMRQDMLDKYNLEQPDTLDEVYEVCKTIYDGEMAETGTAWYMALRAEGNVGLFLPMQRAIDGYPFKIVDMMAIIQEDGSVESYLESDQFKQWCEFAYKSNQAGMIYQDLLSMDTGSVGEPTERGNFLISDRQFTGEATVRANYDENARFVNFYLDQESPRVRFSAYPNCNTISATSPNPEAGVMFLNWLYSDAAHMQLLLYGVEGTHWIDEGGRELSYPEYNVDPSNGSGGYQYAFGNWQVNYADYTRFQKGSGYELSAEVEYSYDDECLTASSAGFMYNPDQAAAEYANCKAVITTYINPILLGFQSYDEAFPSAIQRMKDAGVDKVIAEIAEQYAAFANK